MLGILISLGTGILLILGILILLGIILPLSTEDAVTAQSLYLVGETPTIPVDTPTPVPTPMPVGGDLSMVDRGSVLRANSGLLILPLVALVIIIGIIGLVAMRRRPPA